MRKGEVGGGKECIRVVAADHLVHVSEMSGVKTMTE